MRAKDWTGHRFGSLTALSVHGAGKRNRKWLCRCDCGKTTSVFTSSLVTGHTRSCGCARQISRLRGNLRHGGTRGGKRSPEIISYYAAKGRCTNPNNPSYPRYGGRGITMCEKWLNDPAAFLQDMGPKPDGYTLDRLDNDGPYAPENCRWATITDQARNKSNLRKDESGRILILDVVARGMDPRAYNWRMRHGWTHEEACSVPIGVRRKRYYSTQ